MKILFAARSVGHLSYYSSLIDELLGRGHKVHLFFDRGWSRDWTKKNLEKMLENDNLSYSWSLRRVDYQKSVQLLREISNLSWYCWRNDQSDYYKERWVNYFPKKSREFLSKKFVQKFLSYSFVHILIKYFAKMIKPDRYILEEVKEHSADILVCSPGNMRFDTEIEYVIAANKLKIPTIAIVLSWDNLTTKGLFHSNFKTIFTWNDEQKAELAKLHKNGWDDAVESGSLFFDKWHYSNKRQVYKSSIKKYDFKYVLYFGSSSNIATDESWVVKEIANCISQINYESSTKLRLIVRPHPTNYKIYNDLESEMIMVVPKYGKLAESFDEMAMMHETISGSILTVGINTSALIDSIIIGKPTAALIMNKYEKTQNNSVHFNSLKKYNALYICNDTEELRNLIIKLLGGNDTNQKLRESFVNKFIWPHGEKASSYISRSLESML